MFTLRRGIARVGWVFLFVWVAGRTAAIVATRATADIPPPLDAALIAQLAATVIGPPLGVFLLWRLVLWIGQGFWQKPTARTEAVPVVENFQSANSGSTTNDDEPAWARLTFGAAGLAFIAYAVHLGRPPVFPGFSGMIIYLGVVASIAQLIEWIWGFVSRRRHKV